ncbi:MAG: CHAT domain-containing protein [Acidobacteriota bacterium]|nr:MAG: CHAT domain-containing protein [Acidobacteriota bacterium]
MAIRHYVALFVLLLLAAPLAGAQGDESTAPPGGGEEVRRSPHDEEFSQREKEYEELIEEVRRAAPEYASLHYPRPRGYEEISEICLAEEDAALLEYIVGENFSALWVLRRPGAEDGKEEGKEKEEAGLSVFVLERDEVVEAARAFYESISDPLSSDYKERGQALYELVFRPAEPLLEGKTDLFIVPDGILTYVPFEALADERGRYLLDRFTMTYAPSASVLADILQEQAKGPAADAGRKTAFLGVGDPVFSESGKSTQEEHEKQEKQEKPEEGEGEGGGDSFPDEPATLRGLYEEEGYSFARLPYTGVEVEAVAELFGSGEEDVLLRGRAREEEIKRRDLAKYEIIHFATHGVVDEEFPPRSGVVLSLPGGPRAGEDGFLQVAEIFNLRLDADLVTLSACRAGLGEDTVRGEGLAGLTRAFLHAGAPSVLVSLWSVNELTTAHLMKQFYTRLREGQTKAEALRGARSAMAEKKIDLGPLKRRLQEREAAAASDGKADAPPAKKGGRRMDASHPFYWAAFVLVGSPG